VIIFSSSAHLTLEVANGGGGWGAGAAAMMPLVGIERTKVVKAIVVPATIN
jgi:hypothetical protein